MNPTELRRAVALAISTKNWGRRMITPGSNAEELTDAALDAIAKAGCAIVYPVEIPLAVAPDGAAERELASTERPDRHP